MLRDLIRFHCGNRLFEWVMTLAMLLLALHLVIWPAAFGASAFRYLTVFVSAGSIAFFFLVFGLARVAALIANGQWPVWGPMIRAISALAAAVLWGSMSYALLLLIPNVGTPPSPGIPVYFSLMIGELVSCYRVFANAAAVRS